MFAENLNNEKDSGFVRCGGERGERHQHLQRQ